jgi:CDP-diacylglycerol---glycerol-3-phosphate 3-phosphatidyltransferase
MITVYDLKPRFQNLLRPITQYLAERNITANQVTMMALAVSVVTGGMLVMLHASLTVFLALPVVLFVRMALNAIDGMLAREHHMKSALGAILNEITDVLSDVALYLPFALLPTVSLWLVVVLVIFAIISEMMGVVAVQIGASRRYDGPMGKSDRAFVFGVIALAIGCGIAPGLWMNYVFGVVLLLTVWTVVNRARHALLEIGQ